MKVIDKRNWLVCTIMVDNNFIMNIKNFQIKNSTEVFFFCKRQLMVLIFCIHIYILYPLFNVYTRSKLKDIVLDMEKSTKLLLKLKKLQSKYFFKPRTC